MIIYNLFPTLAGNFGQWGPHLQRAADMGFNWIFTNPIQMPGFSGSLYSIKDYFRFNPLLLDESSAVSPEDQVRGVINRAGDLGLSMMVDLVINHCAIDSELIKDHPKWFERDAKGEIAHPGANENGKRIVWGDLAKFNHKTSADKEGLYAYVLSIVEYMIGLGFKGFRCDAAYQVPGPLWKRLISDTKKKHPNIKFFAETLGCTADQTAKTASAGFDYIFNSSKWWDMHGHWLMEQYNLTRQTAPSVSFPESHDTMRSAEEYQGNARALIQRYFFSAFYSAGVMMTMGYEFGFRKKPHVVKTRPSDWETTGMDLRDYIKKVNKVKREHPIFQEEAPTEILQTDNPNVMLMWKASLSSKEEALIIINKDAHNWQHFYADNLNKYIQSGLPLTDLSPEYPVEFIASPYNYDLNPGQGLVMVTTRENGGY